MRGRTCLKLTHRKNPVNWSRDNWIPFSPLAPGPSLPEGRGVAAPDCDSSDRMLPTPPRSKSWTNRAAEQVVRDPLHALVGAVRAAPVRPRQHVARRRAQALRPEDRRGVEDEVALRARDRSSRSSAAARRRPDPGGALGDDFQAGRSAAGRRGTPSRPGRGCGRPSSCRCPRRSSGPACVHDPVAAAVDRLDVAGADQVALVGPALGERAVLLLAVLGVARTRRRRGRRGT